MKKSIGARLNLTLADRSSCYVIRTLSYTWGIMNLLLKATERP